MTSVSGPPTVRGPFVGWQLARCTPSLVLIVLATIWPNSDFTGHSHWRTVEWIPFTVYRGWFDPIANVALFFPLGATFAQELRIRRSVLGTVVVALVVSFIVEFLQVYTHNRVAAVTDVMMNIVGAWLGATLALWYKPSA